MSPNVDQVWFKEIDDGVINIGFTQEFLNSLNMCWHIMPASNVQFKKKSPLFTIETDDSLISVLSPVDGYYDSFNPKAQNFPDKIKASDTILTVVHNKRSTVVLDAPIPPARQPLQWDRLDLRPMPPPAPRQFVGNGAAAIDALVRQHQEILNQRAQIERAAQPQQDIMENPDF